MPFTLCHPAIVLPLYRFNKQTTSLPGLVIGSMAPDFVYFFPLGISGAFTHTPLGLLLYCLPAGMVMYIFYQCLLREPLVAWVPDAVSTRMHGARHWPLYSALSMAVVTGSLAIGAASHIAWDSFTHPNTVIVNSHEIFMTAVSLGGYPVPLFKLLQYLSSIIGFVVIAGFMAAWFKRTVPVRRSCPSLTTRQRLLAFAGVALAAVAGGAAGLLVRPMKSVEHGLFNFVVTGMAAAALAIVCLCFFWQVRTRRRASHASAKG